MGRTDPQPHWCTKHVRDPQIRLPCWGRIQRRQRTLRRCSVLLIPGHSETVTGTFRQKGPLGPRSHCTSLEGLQDPTPCTEPPRSTAPGREGAEHTDLSTAAMGSEQPPGGPVHTWAGGAALSPASKDSGCAAWGAECIPLRFGLVSPEGRVDTSQVGIFPPSGSVLSSLTQSPLPGTCQPLALLCEAPLHPTPESGGPGTKDYGGEQYLCLVSLAPPPQLTQHPRLPVAEAPGGEPWA